MYALIILIGGSAVFLGNCIRNKYYARRVRFCPSVAMHEPLINTDYDYSRLEPEGKEPLPV